MVSAAPGRVVLFSIHPRYAQAILDGSKQVEYRRQGLPDDVTQVVIYATSPVQKVVGTFQVAGVDKLTPVQAWNRYHHVGGIAKAAFERYYAGADTAFVIRVRDPHAFETPFVLADLDERLRAPQSFMYLRDEMLERARELAGELQRRRPVIKRVLTGITAKMPVPAGGRG